MKFSVLLAAGSVALILAAPSAAGRIEGTASPDLMLGTAHADRIYARAGADRIDVAGGRRDTVSCGSGRDIVAADPSDRLARDCERITRRISTDPFTQAGPLHASEAEPDTFSRGAKIVAAFQVGRYRDGGAQAIGFAFSSDAGRTWRHGLLPRLTVGSRLSGSPPLSPTTSPEPPVPRPTCCDGSCTTGDRKSTRLNSSHFVPSRMPSSA